MVPCGAILLFLLRGCFAVWLQLPTAALLATPVRLVLHLSSSVVCERVAGREAGWGGFSMDNAQLYVLVESRLPWRDLRVHITVKWVPCYAFEIDSFLECSRCINAPKIQIGVGSGM